MKRLIALSVVALMLSGCSQKAALKDLANGSCTVEQAQLVKEHISGQIDAIAKGEWESAYSFASPAFRAAVSLDEFVTIIETQYEALILNQGYAFNTCSIANSQITQNVEVTSDAGVINLTYLLSVKDLTLGIEAAVLSNADTALVV
jgi:hypothetical protein